MSTGTPNLSTFTPEEAASVVVVGAVSYGAYKWLSPRIRASNAEYEIQKATRAMQGRLEELDRKKEDFPQKYSVTLETEIWDLRRRVMEIPRSDMTAWRSKLLEREAVALQSRLNAWIEEEDTAPVSKGVKLAK